MRVSYKAKFNVFGLPWAGRATMTLSRGRSPGFPQRQWRSEMNERLASPVPARLRLLAGTVLSAVCAPAGANPVTAGTGAILPVLGGVVLLCALVVGWLAWRRWRPARVEEAGPGARDPKCLQALFAATDDPFQPAPDRYKRHCTGNARVDPRGVI